MDVWNISPWISETFQTFIKTTYISHRSNMFTSKPRGGAYCLCRTERKKINKNQPQKKKKGKQRAEWHVEAYSLESGFWLLYLHFYYLSVFLFYLVTLILFYYYSNISSDIMRQSGRRTGKQVATEREAAERSVLNSHDECSVAVTNGRRAESRVLSEKSFHL